MNPNPRHRRFLNDHTGLPLKQFVGLIGSHRRVVWPPLCPACGAPASTPLEVAKIFGRRARHTGRAHYRVIVRMPIPYCPSCTERHQQLLPPLPSVIGSFFRTPAILTFIGAMAVAGILTMIFLQGGEGLSQGARLYAVGGILFLVGLGIVIPARDARFLRIPPLTDVTRACDFSDNVGYPFGRRRVYAIRNEACAAAFTRANEDRIWTEAIQKRDAWISGIVALLLIVAALVVWLFRRAS